MSAYFESVGDVWIVWAITLFIITLTSRHLFNRFRLHRLQKFHGCESGASYALPYVLTFPIFMIVMATFIQATLILMAKIGTLYAANNACRTYIVWQSAGQGASVAGIDIDYPKYKAYRAASQAMVPFASSFKKHQTDIAPSLVTLHSASDLAAIGQSTVVAIADREVYLKMYRNILSNANAESAGTETSDIITNRTQGSSDQYIRDKYIYANLATAVEVPEAMVKWNGDMAVKVTYRMPFMIPGTANILRAERFPPYVSVWGKWFGLKGVPYRDIETTVIMPAEAAKTDDGTVGIPYQPSLFVDLLN